MDEVDKIIITSLRQIGCNINIDEVCSLTNFTPELLVHAVSTCLQEIKPTNVLPRSLPAGMTQRFTVATALAEACTAAGYNSDIGYQTFLYPNVLDVRRLLMFLIEILPKESAADEALHDVAAADGELAALEREVKRNIQQALRAPWLPPFCRQISNRNGSSNQSVQFRPQLNLHIPGSQSDTAQTYVPPNIFHQMAKGHVDLTSSVLHKNDIDLQAGQRPAQQTPPKFVTIASAGVSSAATPVSAAIDSVHTETLEPQKPSISQTPVQLITEQVNALKCANDELSIARKQTNNNINELKALQAGLQKEMVALRASLKMHERACVVLQEPTTNVARLEALLDASLEKRKTLEQQWQSYREPLQQRLKQLQLERSTKQTKNSASVRDSLTQLEQSIREKQAAHAALSAELRQPEKSRLVDATRKDYTERIMEFIRNIRKQRDDIYKVLDDTRDLQKQINTVSAQLQRQFNYTDDLLFKSAKHDAHAKKAYKLLAALHTACNELVELVTQTGNVTKEIREFEEHIEREKIKNIAINLEKISLDIKNFENVVKDVQAKIHEVENRITQA